MVKCSEVNSKFDKSSAEWVMAQSRSFEAYVANPSYNELFDVVSSY